MSATHLADQSALARLPIPSVEEQLRPMLASGRIATCAVIDLEVLYSARNLEDFEVTLKRRRSLEEAPITPEVTALAGALQHELARRGQHRLPIPDLLISAAAQVAGLTVLHYDADFDRLAEVGGAASEWVVPQGSLS